MKLSRETAAFEDRLGHHFANPGLLVAALTHPSIATPGRPDNQRLEFLGDRVLGLVMAESVLHADKAAREGQLAPRFNALVRRETCADVAREINLGDVLRLGRSEMMTGGRRKEGLLADAMEAVIAAVYLDGGFDPARKVILQLWGNRVHDLDEDVRDAKSSLQEWAQARGLPPPDYIETERTGPPHAPVFTIEVRLQDGNLASAQAGSKRAAEQMAAADLLARLNTEDRA